MKHLKWKAMDTGLWQLRSPGVFRALAEYAGVNRWLWWLDVAGLRQSKDHPVPGIEGEARTLEEAKRAAERQFRLEIEHAAALFGGTVIWKSR